MSRSLGVVAAALAALACAGPRRPPLDPAQFQARSIAGPPARVALAVAGSAIGAVEVASGGAFLARRGPRRVPVVHVRLTVRNGDAFPFRVPLGGFVLEGTDGRLARPLAVFGGRPRDGAIVVPAGQARAVDVVWALPDERALVELPKFLVFWGVDLPGGLVRKSTRFSPAPSDRPRRLARAFRAEGATPGASGVPATLPEPAAEDAVVRPTSAEDTGDR